MNKFIEDKGVGCVRVFTKDFAIGKRVVEINESIWEFRKMRARAHTNTYTCVPT